MPGTGGSCGRYEPRGAAEGVLSVDSLYRASARDGRGGLLGVSIFIFFMLHVIYPSPAIDVLGPHGEQVLDRRSGTRQHGFDDPWIVQYLHYMQPVAARAISATPTS